MTYVQKGICLSILICLWTGVFFFGCAPQPVVVTPATPNLQTQILQADKTLADTINGAVRASISLRDQGKISQADTLTIQNYCKSAVAFSEGLDKIVTDATANNESWPSERNKIIALTQAVTLPVIGNVSPAVAVVLTQIVTIVNQVRNQVGL